MFDYIINESITHEIDLGKAKKHLIDAQNRMHTFRVENMVYKLASKECEADDRVRWAISDIDQALVYMFGAYDKVKFKALINTYFNTLKHSKEIDMAIEVLIKYAPESGESREEIERGISIAIKSIEQECKSIDVEHLIDFLNTGKLMLN